MKIYSKKSVKTTSFKPIEVIKSNLAIEISASLFVNYLFGSVVLIM